MKGGGRWEDEHYLTSPPLSSHVQVAARLGRYLEREDYGEFAFGVKVCPGLPEFRGCFLRVLTSPPHSTPAGPSPSY